MQAQQGGVWRRVHDESGRFCSFVREEVVGHGALLRCALRSRRQVAFLWAEDATDAAGKPVVRIHTAATEEQPDW